MSYYRPTSVVFLMFFLAGLYSLCFPVLGLISAKYQYIMVEITYDHDDTKRNNWSTYWILLCVGIGLMSACERGTFMVMGENLTARVRNDLIRGVIYK